ncbi:hypothetical protein BsWGS_15151 [Bradybaena similaris]
MNVSLVPSATTTPPPPRNSPLGKRLQCGFFPGRGDWSTYGAILRIESDLPVYPLPHPPSPVSSPWLRLLKPHNPWLLVMCPHRFSQSCLVDLPDVLWIDTIILEILLSAAPSLQIHCVHR